MKKQILLSIAILAANSTDIFAFGRSGGSRPSSPAPVAKQTSNGGTFTAASEATVGNVAYLSKYSGADLNNIAKAAYDAAQPLAAQGTASSQSYVDAAAILG